MSSHDTDSTGGVRYKQGIVADAKPGFATVRFADLDGLVTRWLPVIHPKTQDDKAAWTLDVGEHVACLMDQYLEDGCIVGAIYSEADVPPVASREKFRVQFKDGGSFEYDRSSGAMEVVCKGMATLRAEGDVLVKTPAKITLDAPEAVCTGNLTVMKTLIYQQGMQGSGSAPGTGGDSAVIDGTVRIRNGDLRVRGGDVSADDISLKHHKNKGVKSGDDLSGEAVA